MNDKEDEYLLTKYKWYINAQGYLVRNRRKNEPGTQKLIRLHRYIIGAKSEEIVDHIDGNKLNNKKENLRITNTQGNAQNSFKKINNKSGYKGVSFENTSRNLKKKWRADIQIGNKRYNLGRFLTKEEAAKAYDSAAIKYFGEFAKTNFKYGK